MKNLRLIVLAVLMLSVTVVFAAPSLQITAPPVVNNGWTGPTIDPTASQGQWFVDEATRQTTETRTHEFYDNVDPEFGGGTSSYQAIKGIAQNVVFAGGAPGTNILSFEIAATITNDTPALSPWLDGANSHLEALITPDQYEGILIAPKLTAEFAIADLSTLPNGFSAPYRQGFLPHIIAVNEDELAWYCYTPGSPPQGASTAIGNYYVPTWNYPDIPHGGSATVILKFIVDGSGLNPADPRYEILLGEQDLLLNRTTSLKISTWIDDLTNDTGVPYPTNPYESSDVSVFHNIQTQPDEERDYGDAPEGSTAIAYPSTGQTGNFPTCKTVGPAGSYVEHNNFGAWFGNFVDFELDGNAGNCPGCFPPYDRDECFDPASGNNSDPGLIMPESYTIDGLNNVVACPTCTGSSLGQTCNTAVWGTDVDIWVHNTMPGHEPYLIAYVNVLMDWNQDGQWGGSSTCPGGITVPEHVLVDFQIPALYIGQLSTVMAAGTGFTIGPNPGYVWTRFSITESPVGAGWDGSGVFEDGESEDYLLLIDSGTSDPNIKYVQWPDKTVTGVDIRIDESDGVVRHIADDFPCTVTGPITDIHFWGSWEDDDKGQIDSIVARIYSDDPVGLGGTLPDNEYSMPDVLLWTGQFYNYEIIETLDYTLPGDEFEWWWDPFFGALKQNGDQNIWKYDIYIDPCEAFVQRGTPEIPIVYWLELQVNKEYDPDANGFGWKTSESHWNDDAVFANGSIYPWVNGWSELRYPLPHPNSPDSIDMAFMITTGYEPNEPDYKWLQKPDLSEMGIDIKATEPFILADDFLCNETNLITEITVWGSWKNDVLPLGGPDDVRFTLSLHTDIPDPNPADPCTYSMPADAVWLKIFEPKTYNVTIERRDILEGWWSPDDPLGYLFPGDTICFKYVFTIDPNEAFVQEGTPEAPIVYWLDVQAKPIDMTGEAEFGWKTSLYHWNDDAVWGTGFEPFMGPWNELIYPPMHEMAGLSIDLAFALGSTEISDLGDAPDSTNNAGTTMTAYPGPIIANFPTVYGAGSPPYGPLHLQSTNAFYLGNVVSMENEADIGPDQDSINNLNVAMDTPDLDGFDDGVVVPLYLPRCRMITFDYTVSVVDITKPIYANVWFDWNRDGDWDDIATCDLGKPADEWAVKDQTLGFTAPGTYTVTTPPFRTYDDIHISDLPDIWMRITLSEIPAMLSGSGGSGPSTGYIYGETEDYFFSPDTSCSDCADFDLSGVIDWLDLKELTDNWLWTTSGSDFREADLDCDGDIEFVDFAILAEQWFLSCP